MKPGDRAQIIIKMQELTITSAPALMLNVGWLKPILLSSGPSYHHTPLDFCLPLAYISVLQRLAKCPGRPESPGNSIFQKH